MRTVNGGSSGIISYFFFVKANSNPDDEVLALLALGKSGHYFIWRLGSGNRFCHKIAVFFGVRPNGRRIPVALTSGVIPDVRPLLLRV